VPAGRPASGAVGLEMSLFQSVSLQIFRDDYDVERRGTLTGVPRAVPGYGCYCFNETVCVSGVFCFGVTFFATGALL